MKQDTVKETNVALYVHLPFCKRKCAYCDFISFTEAGKNISPYISLVLREWQAIRESLFPFGTSKVTSCYLGGGTPSLLSEKEIYTLVRGLFPYGAPPNMEFSIEANPESLTNSKLSCYRDLGINRISLGIQSFDDLMLHLLGRTHTASQAVKALIMIQDNGWENYNIDLMYGLPGQSVTNFSKDLEKALSFRSPHLSSYCLTVSPSTPLGKDLAEDRLILPDEDNILKMMDILEDMTAETGLEHYEISNFARPGFACKHNLTYWQLNPYFGLGIGAGSYYRQNGERWGSHWENPTTLNRYTEMVRTGHWAFKKRLPLSRETFFMETLLTHLRLKKGIDIRHLILTFGEGFTKKSLQRIEPIIQEGWLEIEKGYLKATKKGSRIMDALILEMISEIS